MHPQLELLLELQDLKTQRRSLAEDGLSEVESAVFELRPSEALEILDGKIEELAGRLEAPVRARFSEVSQSLGRAVAPVLNGICYGCFVAIPTAWSSEVGRNDRINVCDHCGRFLYYVD
ncbi:MAG: C4-type zinc ribbon domain-containing protein [marine benthic group bacterium]|jgi:predicted  nucleic acid-binding Zn-ribbon protein|nr:C4-type zinc ribbon domain-containing protein [Gemmatimonadota bacterium]MCL7975447.1 C4-type zinc ribbon domain-containing protein [Gemmatimonadota bacterium]MCL7980112.1 C4-type zinc ribbon domain-containing protein [Gemmatimonadota bacterium]MCL7981333.1 C4-type zinc ribbon domain-containing protein [Gemmatimonadota bacterium]MCL7986086.1 C4-type zinc ribbon domain-containing protein [Gemmatimonadota bacterium]